MAKKNKKEVVEEITETTKQETTAKEEIKLDEKVEKLKVKKPKMKKLQSSEIIDEVTKVDVTKPVENEEDVVTKVAIDDSTKETPVVEEITDEKIEEAQEKLEEVVEETAEAVEEAVEKAVKTGEPLPENIQKLVNFMDETGGDLEDYVKLNQDYSKLDNHTLLREYYNKTKPHLSSEEVEFLMEDNFSYDENTDEENDIKRKKLALKEQVADARATLEGYKSKYYEEIKGGSKLTEEQREAINFYEGWKEESQETKEFNETAKSTFLNRTNKFFGDQFKGFEYNVGDKKFRFNVSNTEEVRDTQSDINNFIGKFLDKNQVMKDAPGYHKSLFTAMNPDAVANHFYEQGKADAMKDSISRAKNIDMSPRQAHGEVKDMGGVKVRVITDDNSPTFKVKKRMNN